MILDSRSEVDTVKRRIYLISQHNKTFCINPTFVPGTTWKIISAFSDKMPLHNRTGLSPFRRQGGSTKTADLQRNWPSNAIFRWSEQILQVTFRLSGSLSTAPMPGAAGVRPGLRTVIIKLLQLESNANSLSHSAHWHRWAGRAP